MIITISREFGSGDANWGNVCQKHLKFLIMTMRLLN